MEVRERHGCLARSCEAERSLDERTHGGIDRGFSRQAKVRPEEIFEEEAKSRLMGQRMSHPVN